MVLSGTQGVHPLLPAGGPSLTCLLVAHYKQKGACRSAPSLPPYLQVVHDPEHSPAHLLTMARPSAFLTSSRSVVMKSREDRRSNPLASCRYQVPGAGSQPARCADHSEVGPSA